MDLDLNLNSDSDTEIRAPAIADLAAQRAGELFAATRARISTARELPPDDLAGDLAGDTEPDTESNTESDGESVTASSLVADWFGAAPSTPGALSAWSAEGSDSTDQSEGPCEENSGGGCGGLDELDRLSDESDPLDSTDQNQSSASSDEIAEEMMWDVEVEMSASSLSPGSPFGGESGDETAADAAQRRARGHATWRRACRAFGERTGSAVPATHPGRVVRHARRSRALRAALSTALERRERQRVAPAIPASEFRTEVEHSARQVLRSTGAAWATDDESGVKFTRRALAMMRTAAEGRIGDWFAGLA